MSPINWLNRRLEWTCWENEQYSRRECTETSGIPQSIKQIGLEKTLIFFDKIAPVDPQNIKIHRLKSDNNGQSNKVIVKFSKRKDMVQVIEKC